MIIPWPFISLVTVLICLLPLSASANPDIASLTNQSSVGLNPYMYIYTDTTNTLTIKDISKPEFQSEFIKNQSSMTNLGLSHHNHWVRVTLTQAPSNSPSAEPVHHWYLEIAKSMIDIAELYLPTEDGHYRSTSSDMREGWAHREFRHVYSVFPLSTLDDETLTIYIKLRNNTMLFVPLTLWERSAFIHKVGTEEFFYGLFFGGMAIMIIYNLFVYFSVRDSGYLYYVLYLSSITYFEILETGHGVIHLQPFTDIIGENAIPITVLFALSCGGMFSRKFLDLPTLYPKIDILARHLTFIAGLSIIPCLFIDMQVVIIWITLYSTLCLSFLLTAGVYMMIQRNANAQLFFAAWLFAAIGFIVYSLMVNQVIPTNTLTVMAAPFAVFLESVVFSFALARRIKTAQRKKLLADSAAMKNLEKYSSAFNNSQEGMYEMTLDGRIVSANRTMATIMGVTQVRTVLNNSSQIARIIFGDPNHAFAEIIRHGEISKRIRIQSGEGNHKWINHRSLFSYDHQGRRQGIKGSVTDITEEIEKEISIHRGELERLEREAALKTTEEKSHFLTMMSHEIRVPLTAIIGFGESLQESSLERTEKKEYIDIIGEHSRRLLRLINNILDLSKLDAEKFDVEKIEFNLGKAMNQLLNRAIRRAKAKSLYFNLNYDTNIPSHIVGDPTRIAQVLDNLCENALFFTQHGGIDLSVTWHAHQLSFTITDTGPGISEDLVNDLFTLTGDSKNVYTLNKGSGLGLPISKQLATLMGGNIHYKSNHKNGSTFVFSCKAEIGANFTWLSKPILPTSKHSLSTPSLHGLVLLAEDNPVNQVLIKKILEATGITVAVAADGVEACEYCENHQPDLILMDINMPKRDGIAATQHLRENGFSNPIVALTAETDTTETDKALHAGCQRVIGKPINKKETYALLQQYLMSPLPTTDQPIIE